ncbi:P35 family lipoprotein [Malacoplasma iowae]|uniref:P35 family lipoprotein n=1 Tax=Malacoplasma iowae TaxID=2116 RepID=UPI002A186C06|nr:P35 family lipoprotein [Malacoplasma iowae]WPL39443.1 P35 family lipoprotein [Malacoplasma iowae]
MKNKKTKFIKLLSIGGAVMAIGAVPIVMTSCAKKSTSQTVTKVTPKIKSNITLVGKFSDLVSETDEKTTDQLISEDLQKNISKVIENSNEIKEAKVTFNSNLTDDDKKFNDGTKEYSEWKASASSNVVYYSSASPQLNVKSTKDLNAQITSGLNAIMKDSGFVDATNKDFKLNDTNKIGVDKDMLHVSVTATNKGAAKNAATTEIDLVIPTSDINFTPDKATIEVSGSNVDTKKQQVTFKYDVGIDSTINFTKETIDLEAGKNIANGTDVLEALGWKQVQTTGKQLLRHASVSVFSEQEGTGTNDINSEKMGNDIGVFNSKFTNFKVIETEKDSGLYSLTVSATPNEGYQWDDGTNVQKDLTIATNVDINVKDAYWGTGLVGTIDSYNTGLDTNDKTNLESYFENIDNRKKFSLKVDEANSDKFFNLHAEILKWDNTNGGGWVKASADKWQIRMKLVPNSGHTYKGDSQYTEEKASFTVIITKFEK